MDVTTIIVKGYNKIMAIEKAVEQIVTPPKGSIKCKVPMTLDHFNDFYFLQSLQVNISTRIAANPELQFKKSVEKLKEDVDQAIEEIVPNIALRTFVYLYAACLGEARHASTSCAVRCFVPETRQRERSELYAMIAEFAPSKENIDTLVTIFDQKWLAGYGGEPWKNIADALHMYHTATPAAFIDYVIDLEHNGGTVFNKTDAKYAIKFIVKYNGRLKHFLDYKFQYNILERSYHADLSITNQVYKLIERYTTIFNTEPVTWVTPALQPLDEYVVNWGDRAITIEVKWTNGVDVSKGNIPHSRWLMNKTGMFEIYPGAYTLAELKKRLAGKKKEALKKAGKHATKELDKRLDTVINKWLKWAKNQTKVTKFSKTYPVLPCKVLWGAYGIKLAIPVKCGKIGKQTPYGFELTTENHAGIMEKAIDAKTQNYINDGELYEDGHLTNEYGKVVLHLKSGNWNLPEKKLEALLD